ncbi:hypothetical protein LCGC14_0042740 [marine sediment metagenome]|uniref:Uncharacterized protein n=1 Tax=marine sediment metagenome TaxID=412755 RepID=A0A0F9VTB4_9ZZZZ
MPPEYLAPAVRLTDHQRVIREIRVCNQWQSCSARFHGGFALGDPLIIKAVRQAVLGPITTKCCCHLRVNELPHIRFKSHEPIMCHIRPYQRAFFLAIAGTRKWLTIGIY